MTRLPPGPFGVLLLDPPWKYVTYDGKSSVPTLADDPYPTMSHDELLALPVSEVAAKNAVLFMWVVDAHLEQALALGCAYGFTFKTVAFIWLKETQNGRQLDIFKGESDPVMSLGHWTRKQAEICLLFTRGKPKRLSKAVRQVIRDPRREHSRKPDEQYARIEALVGGPYLEMFARQARPNWAAWGSETDRFEAAA